MILDTSFCVDLIRETARKESGPARRKMISLLESEIFLSLFSVCELRAGAELSRHPKQELEKVEKLISYTRILYPESSFPVLYGETEAFLRLQGIPIPVMDLLIAVSAKAAGLPLLTRDRKHFDRIPSLVVETY